jgi:hypothetical protein
MVRPCVARGFRRSVGSSVLHQCIRPLIGASAPGHHGYQRACVLISGQASNGPCGPPVFACAGKTGPPSRFILSQTSAGNDCWAMSSLAPHRCSSFVRAMRPFLRPGLCLFQGTARRGRQGWPSRLAHLWLGISRPRLDGPEHGATLTQIGTLSHLSSHIRICTPC